MHDHYVKVHKQYIFPMGLKRGKKLVLNRKYVTISPKSHSTETCTELIVLVYDFVRFASRNGICKGPSMTSRWIYRASTVGDYYFCKHEITGLLFSYTCNHVIFLIRNQIKWLENSFIVSALIYLDHQIFPHTPSDPGRFHQPD